MRRRLELALKRCKLSRMTNSLKMTMLKLLNQKRQPKVGKRKKMSRKATHSWRDRTRPSPASRKCSKLKKRKTNLTSLKTRLRTRSKRTKKLTLILMLMQRKIQSPKMRKMQVQLRRSLPSFLSPNLRNPRLRISLQSQNSLLLLTRRKKRR